MDRPITATEANQRFSEMLRDVGRGESFVVTSRGRPVARVVPVEDLTEQARAVEDLLAYVKTLPPMKLHGWRREDLYDRSDRD